MSWKITNSFICAALITAEYLERIMYDIVRSAFIDGNINDVKIIIFFIVSLYVTAIVTWWIKPSGKHKWGVTHG